MVNDGKSGYKDIYEGATCLLRVMDERFWVRIIETGDEVIRVSFPGRDYPVNGMTVELEFHSETGFNVYETEMMGRPSGASEGILLRKPVFLDSRTHRASARVRTGKLKLQVKDQIHMQRYTAELLNISRGGALFRTEAPFGFDTTVEITLNLPDEPPHHLLGHILHINAGQEVSPGMQTIGARFISPEKHAQDAIERYVARQLRNMYVAN